MSKYNTIKKYAREETIIKKSKFIASVTRASTEEDAWKFVNKIKEEFSDATHNVFAFRIGRKGEITKQSDDGEPGGTAGKPVLEVIKNEDLKDTVVVVTRYFGGIYLGAGGLVRAYSSAAHLGIKTAGIVKKQLFKKLSIKIDYSSWGKLQNELKNIFGIVEDAIYEDMITLTVLIPPDQLDYLKDLVNNLTGGTGNIDELDELYMVP
ncbi:YigZ family protein [Natranaerofaba carboxydovora]|uniref:YigZ family protein n=1 Tax=Natranaerofaba carboxydovora TaxID=2742683 RepID=UPI001F13D96D|nr:YigZ family protein [Natranaerofaba carboxydovora]UMZ75334.1 IMPACT family member YigZ [Natranaerofaba carboxydovora]